jgi:hypothetical protein
LIGQGQSIQQLNLAAIEYNDRIWSIYERLCREPQCVIYNFVQNYPLNLRWYDDDQFLDYSAEMFPDDLFFDIHYNAALSAHNRIDDINLWATAAEIAEKDND